MTNDIEKITLPNPTKSNLREAGRCIIGLFIIIGLVAGFCWLGVWLTSPYSLYS